MPAPAAVSLLTCVTPGAAVTHAVSRLQQQPMKEKAMSPRMPSEPVTSNDAASRRLAAVISPDQTTRPVPGPLTGRSLWTQVVTHARCAEDSLDPDEWFPVSAEAGIARREAAAAIAVCTACPVRGQCLALSLRYWDIGQHGVWGGLVAAERAQIRVRSPAIASASRRMAALGGRP